MRRKCYLLPGFMGTELVYADDPNRLLWCDYAPLSRGEVRFMALAANGIDPLPPDGVALVARDPLPKYFSGTIELLPKTLQDDNYQVVPWGYDWRLDMRVIGHNLAEEIRAEVSAADPCTIVGHSGGGLVARCAWADLVNTGNENLVRRIITIGTPHWGTYSVPKAFFGGGPTLNQLQFLNFLGKKASNDFASGPPVVYLSGTKLAAIVASWPAAYQLLPALDSPAGYPDPLRFDLYIETNYAPGAHVSADRLDEARQVWQRFLKSPESQPPSSILTTVAGQGSPTTAALRAVRPAPLGIGSPLDEYQPGRDGDNTVVTEDAFIEGSVKYYVPSIHMDLLIKVTYQKLLRDWILDSRVAPGPPPAPPTAYIGRVAPNNVGPPIQTNEGFLVPQGD